MARRIRTVSAPPTRQSAGSASAIGATAIVVLILSAASLVLLLTAPTDGDFWWSDAPRHALNGAFVRDFVVAHPLHDPLRWAIEYYLRRPALTIMFYPPLFYVAEAITFTVAGVSHFAAQFTVSLFVLLLGISAYALSRLVLPRWAAVGAALLVIGTPETALWGRQVMLDLPAYALAALAAVCLSAYLRTGRPVAVYLAALALLAAIYTKYNAGFIALPLVATFLVAKGRATLHDRHALTAALLVAIGLLPAIVMLRRFGAANLTSMSGLQDTLPLNSLACWLFYLRALPGQLGWLTLVLGAGGLAVVAKRSVIGPNRWTYALPLTWLMIGYLAFTLISLKETRDTIMILLPLAIAAPLFLVAVLPEKLGEAAGLALGLGTLLYTLAFCPVPRVEGYRNIASFLAKNVAHDGVVLYAGYRDANLIFDLAATGHRPDITIIRADKLLLSVPVGERRRGVRQSTDDEARIRQLLRRLGASYFVVQPDFWSDLAVMRRFDTVINGPDYAPAGHFRLEGDLSTQDGTRGIDILRPTYPVTPASARISIDMPLAGQRFEGTPRP